MTYILISIEFHFMGHCYPFGSDFRIGAYTKGQASIPACP